VAHENLLYGQGVTDQGETVDLRLDIYQPPESGNQRPAIVMIHGGAFRAGTKIPLRLNAKEYARRGFVGISIEYRLASEGYSRDLSIEGGLDAIGDGQLAVKWLRTNAETYDIDPDRIAALGRSAGGTIALGMATDEDLTEGRLANEESASVNAAVSAGLHLTEWIDLGHFDATDPVAPVMLLHYEYDTATGTTAEYAMETCAIFTAEDSCYGVIQSGDGHAALLRPTEPVTADHVMPFLADKLDLASAPSP